MRLSNTFKFTPHAMAAVRRGVFFAGAIFGTSAVVLTLIQVMSNMPLPVNRALTTYLPILLLFSSLVGSVIGCSGYAAAKSDEASRRKALDAALARERAMEPRHRILNGAGDRYALEIRGLGIAVENYWQDGIWTLVERMKDSRRSVLPQETEGYPKTSDERLGRAFRATESISKSVGFDAVSNWPVPGFAALPPSHPSIHESAGQEQASVIRSAGLVYTYTLSVDEVNTEDASSLIEKLFAFFDANPEVPQAILMVRDGDTIRETLKKHGMGFREGPYKPEKALSLVSMLVTRTDRVDKYIRPYSIKEKVIARSPQQLEYDYMKLYKFYWNEDNVWNKTDNEVHAARTLTAGLWASRLPEFLKTIDDKGVPGFQRTTYLPLRWTNWQVGMFDYPPVMGYLHRPITVRLTDDDGKSLTGDVRHAALRDGWKRAVGSLPVDDVPTRVFSDTKYDQGLTKELAGILKDQPMPLNLDDVDQGIDIGVRIGDTGIASPFIQIALGTMASYKLGGPSATVYRRENGDLTFTMVSPPDAETKAAWKHGNPFYAHVGR